MRNLILIYSEELTGAPPPAQLDEIRTTYRAYAAIWRGDQPRSRPLGASRISPMLLPSGSLTNASHRSYDSSRCAISGSSRTAAPRATSRSKVAPTSSTRKYSVAGPAYPGSEGVAR